MDSFIINDEQQPLLSVIIPVYGVEKYIAECLESVINQTYKNMEIIVINDGTKDNSAVIAKQYAEKDNRIKVYDFENGGLSLARNRGVELAKGKYAAFLDSDDKIHPDMYMNMINKLEKYDIDFIKCGFVEFDETQQNIINFKCESYKQFERNLFNKYFEGVLWIIACNAVYKTCLVKKVLFPANIIHEDNYSSGMYLYLSSKVAYVNKAYYYYRVNLNGISKNKNKKPLDRYISIKKLAIDLQKYGYIDKRLFWKMAIEIYHFVRMNDERFKVIKIEKDFYDFIIKNLDFRRKWSFIFLIKKKKVEIIK